MAANLDSFGRIDRRPREALPLDRAIASLNASGSSLLAFGNGKSYGDTCHNEEGVLVPMRSRNAVLGFDTQTGILTTEAGVTLEEIIAHAAPHWGIFTRNQTNPHLGDLES